MSVDTAHDRLKSVVTEVRENLANITTEEDAKVQIILRFFTEVLGWRHSDLGA